VRTVSTWLGALVLLLLAAVPAVGARDAQPAAARLTLDGAPFRPELAATPGARAHGLMNRKKAPADGMLFVFPEPTRTGFWMKNTLVPLTIAFFDASGKRVRRMRMVPCRADPCAIYDPRRVYRFALELPAGDRRPALRLGPRGELRRLVRRAG
jgi:uncharacterized membrane protein (UPF0127 family)